MVCSPAQLSANRKNAGLSTGPRTEAGKARARGNALKHGLTGDGVALPDEDASAVRERFEAFEADLKPKDSVARFLVRRAAMLSVRLERCARNEAAGLTLGMLGARDFEADDRAEEVARLVASIGDDPFEVVRRLGRSPEGVDWMIRAWEGLKYDLLDRVIDRWSSRHRERVEQLIGHKAGDFGLPRVSTLSHAIEGNLRMLPATDWPDLPPLERRQAARGEMAAFIDAQIDRLVRAREGLDHEAIARSRAGADARALFDTSKAATLARTYEAAAERGFYKALKQVEERNASAEADEATAAVVATDDRAERSDQLASFFPGPPPAEGPPSGTRRPAPIGSNSPPGRPKKATSGR